MKMQEGQYQIFKEMFVEDLVIDIAKHFENNKAGVILPFEMASLGLILHQHFYMRWTQTQMLIRQCNIYVIYIQEELA